MSNCLHAVSTQTSSAVIIIMKAGSTIFRLALKGGENIKILVPQSLAKTDLKESLVVVESEYCPNFEATGL